MLLCRGGWSTSIGEEGVGESMMGRMGLFVLVVCVVTQLGHV